MGKNKPNGYALFVKIEIGRMRKRNEVVPVDPFKDLGSKWKSLSDEEKQSYKDRANNCDSGPTGYPSLATSRPPQRPAAPPQPQQQQHPTQTGAAYQQATNDKSQTTAGIPAAVFKLDQDIKVKVEPGLTRDNIDVKPVIKQEERGEKRSWALDIYRSASEGEQQGEEEDDLFGEGPRKKRKPTGYGIPNWKNIKNSTQPDADRYFDYDLLERRNKCKSIVETRAERLMTIPIYTFSCNVLCKYKNVNREWKYIPIEIGIYSYSLEKGPVGQPYNVLINSGEAPKNYFNDSNDHSKKNHKIGFTRAGDYPDSARNCYAKIYKEMCKYTREGERTILVADHRDLSQVTLSIEWLYEKAVEFDKSLPRPSTWTILPLVDFVTEAYNFVFMRMLENPQPKFTLPYYLKMRLESSLWDYEVEYMCAFHSRERNQTKWCAQNCAIRAIKCLETILDEIYNNFKLATEAKLNDEEASHAQAPPPPAGQSVSLQEDQLSEQATARTTNSATPRTAVQQKLQPLYRCPI